MKDFFSKCDQIRSFTFTEEILNRKLNSYVQCLTDTVKFFNTDLSFR